MTQRVKDISSDWIKHKPRGSKEQEEFASLVRNSTLILERLSEIIETKEKEILDLESNEAQYDKNWAVLQAHRNGKKEALRYFKTLTQHLK